ncbi:MAG: glycosyltransferase family 4 protein [Deferribacteraceae bacterium]|jgi:glycosyltransferase involved in cell wall biosynthesis|nr:glycosyltransferase family 4 protein [Deferribacteraceae bacterium]
MKPINHTKKTLLFDVSVLSNALNKGSGRSGIFWVAYNLLVEIMSRHIFEIRFYCAPDRMDDFLRAREQLFTSWKEIPIVNLYNHPSKRIYQIYRELKSRKDNTLPLREGRNVKHFGEGLQEDNPPPKLKLRLPLKGGVSRLFWLSLMAFMRPILLLSRRAYHKIANIDECDIFFSPMNSAPDEIMRAGHIKRFTILHDVTPLVLNNYNQQAWNSWLGKLIRSMNTTDHYFANSEHTKGDFIKYAPTISSEQITVIPLSTGLPYFPETDSERLAAVKAKYNIPTNKRYALSLCTLEPRKNLPFAVKNFIRFIEENNINDLVFVLSGGHWGEFKAIIEREISGIELIISTGYIDDEDMNTLYSGAEVFIYTSLYEGFGMPILEAMQSGCPVICSNTSSMPEVIGSAGITIDPTNDDELVEALNKMYFDHEFRQECISKGVERAKLFSWKKAVDIICETI